MSQTTVAPEIGAPPDLSPPGPPNPSALPAKAGALPKLDFSRIAPPRNLESVRVEELTIDGICGVY